MNEAATTWAGYVLTGGKSSRMGRDKAMLEWRGGHLVEHIARSVERTAGNVTLVGAPERYAELGLAAIADELEDIGPLGGLITALRHSHAEWNLLVACDLPRVSDALLAELKRAAAGDCVAYRTGHLTQQRWEPLCAAYHRSVLPCAERFAAEGRRKMQDFLALLRVTPIDTDETHLFNVNTPEEWAVA